MAPIEHFNGMTTMSRINRIDHILAIIDDVLGSAEIPRSPRSPFSRSGSDLSAPNTVRASR